MDELDITRAQDVHNRSVLFSHGANPDAAIFNLIDGKHDIPVLAGIVSAFRLSLLASKQKSDYGDNNDSIRLHP